MSYYPPSLNYAQSPYGCVPLPRQFTAPLTLDPLLQRVQRGAAISWFVSEHPSSAGAEMLLPYGEVWQNRPATTPRTSALAIWWSAGNRPIVVRGDPYVTVADVLIMVYQMIRHTAQEHYQPTHQPLLMPSPHMYQSPTPSFPPPSDQQVRHWVLSFLNGRFTWDGLSLKPSDPDLWVLHIR